MKKYLLLSVAAALLTTACTPQAPVLSNLNKDISAVRLNNSNVLDLGFEGKNSVRVNVNVAGAAPGFGIRTITQPVDDLALLDQIRVRLFSCANAADAQSANIVNCTQVASNDYAVVGNSVSFNVTNIPPATNLTFEATPLDGGSAMQTDSGTNDKGLPILANSHREFIKTDGMGTVGILEDGSISNSGGGAVGSVGVLTTANDQIDLRIKLAERDGGSVTGNGVAVESGNIDNSGPVLN